MYPVYIPSKGRAETATTPKLLEQVNIPYTLVVEQQEARDYIKHFPNARVTVLNESHRGIAYARNAILEYARSDHPGWYWMIDDDIKQFYRLQDTIFLNDTARVLEDVEKLVNQHQRLAQATIGRKNRTKQKLPLCWNVSCCGCVCNHADRVGTYREHVQEDTDMSLQVVSAGYMTVQFNHIVLSTPLRGQNTGGLQEAYARKDPLEWSQNLVNIWGSAICRIKKTKSAVKVHVNWDYFPSPLEK